MQKPDSFYVGSSDLTPENLSAAGVPRLTLRELANAVRSAASLQVRGSFGDRMELTLRDIARQLDEHAATRLEPIGYASRAAIRNIQLGIQERAAIVPKSEAVDDGDDVPVYFAAAETSKTEGLGQIKQEGISPLSPSLKSLEGKNEPKSAIADAIAIADGFSADEARQGYRWHYGTKVYCCHGTYYGVGHDDTCRAAKRHHVSSGVQTPGNSNGGKGDDLSVEEKADCGLLSELNDPDEGA